MRFERKSIFEGVGKRGCFVWTVGWKVKCWFMGERMGANERKEWVGGAYIGIGIANYWHSFV